MIKKILILIIGVCYTFTVSGISLNYHFCGGSFASVSLSFLNPEKKCCCGNKKMKKDCCQDETVLLKVKDEHKFTGEKCNIEPVTEEISIDLPYSRSASCFTRFYKIYNGNYTSPPPLVHSSLLLQYCILRI